VLICRGGVDCEVFARFMIFGENKCLEGLIFVFFQ